MFRKWNVALGVALLASGLVASGAQQPAFNRTVLQRGDLSAAGREAVMARADLSPGAATGKHTHPGEEIGYMLEGTVTLEVAGQPAKTLNAGDVFLIPAGAIHGAVNSGSAGARILVTYVVEKGKPLTTPAQ